MRIFGILATIGLAAALVFGALSSGAWFTDTETLANNVVTTGTMDLAAGSADAAGSTGPMGFENLEPGAGYVPVGYFWARNDGDYEMKWRGYLSLSGNTGLADYIQVRCTLNPTDGPWSAQDRNYYGPDNSLVFENVGLNALTSYNSHILLADPQWPFAPTHFASYKLEARLLSTAQNAMQDKTLTADLVLDATQYINTGWGQ